MKLKRFLAFVVSLAMVLSIVPAFSLTANAAAPEYDSQFCVDNADYTFDPGDIASTWGNGQQFGSGEANTAGWTGWTSDNTTLRLYRISDNNTFIAADKQDAPQNVYTLTAPSDVVSATSNKDFIVIEWTGNNGDSWGASNGSWFDVRYSDSDAAFDTFRFTKNSTNGINYQWGSSGWIGDGLTNQFASDAQGYTYEDANGANDSNNGTTTTWALYRMVYQNDVDGAGYTASYYYQENGAWNWIGTKTWATGSVANFTSMSVSGLSADMRMNYFAIYAGDYPATSKTIVATYKVDGATVNTVTKVTTEDSASFDAYYYSANGSNVGYYAEAQVLSESTTIEMTAVENEDKVYSKGASITVGEETGTIASGNLIPNAGFDYGVAGWYAADGSAATSANFTTDAAASSVYAVNNGGSGSANTLQRSWAIESGKTYVFTYSQTQTSTDKKWQRFCLGNDFANNNDAMLSGAGAGDVETGQSVVEGTNTVVFTNNNGYKYANFRAAYSQGVTFSNFGLYEIAGLTNDYNVTAVDTNGNTLENIGTVSAISVDALSIPAYDGYIFKTRTVSGTNVTYTYEAQKDTLGTWAIRNNVHNNLYVTDIKYLGTHNAFANHSNPVQNEAGMLINDNDGLFTTTVPGASLSGSSVAASSQTQTLDALEQLNVGVRYFDIRVARHEDGTFWAFHGPSFTELKPVMATIAQFAKENPGEVILLDFQMAYDALYTTVIDDADTTNRPYNGGTKGDDNADFYNDLRVMLSDAGVMDYVRQGDGAWDKQYGPITDYGTKSAIIPIVKARGWNTLRNYGFANRNDAIGTTYAENSSESDVISQITSVVNDTSYNLGSGARWGVIHAYRTTGAISSTFGGTSLIEAANASNPNWMSDADRIEAWMQQGEGDVFMVNNITQAFADIYLEKLSEFNRDEFDEQLGNNFAKETAFVSSGVTLTGPTAALPFSTEFVATKTAATGTMTGSDNVTYDLVAKYELDLRQFDIVKTSGAVLGADATLVFETPGNTLKTYKLLLEDGTVYGTSTTPGGSVTVTYPTGTGYIPVYIAETNAPGVNMTVRYVTSDNTVLVENTAYYVFDTVAYTNSTSDYYITNGENAFIVKGNEDKTYVVTEGVDEEGDVLDVLVTVVNENAVLLDTFGNDAGSADCNNTDNLLFIGSAGVSDPGESDAAGDVLHANAGGNVGSPRIPVLKFNVPTVGENKAVKLHLYVAKANQNLTDGGSMKLAANVSNVAVDEALGYKTGDVVNTDGVVWSDTMFTATGAAVDGRMPVDTWVEIDVTEFVKAATTGTITFTLYAPRAGAYVADREKAVAGGTYQGKAAYLEIVDANTVTVTGAALVTKSGKDVTTDAADGILVPAGSAIKARETSSEVIAFTDGTNVYTTNGDGWVTLTPSSAAEYSAATLGIAMVDGAQVRIGDGVNEDGTVAGNSGLRFITTVDKSDSLAAITGATFGVEITAESSEEVVDIPTTEWQTDGEVFTSALTNLAVSNYNRNFTATPYVSVNGTKYYGSAVTRSIYQVASGLLATGYNGNYGESVDKTGTSYEAMPEVLVKVLNGYVNQVGVRLLIQDGVLVKSDKYTGSADTFFKVSNASTNGSVYTCTLTAVGDAEINTELFNTYVRINNNNKTISTLVSVVDNGDGTYTLTFDGSTLN